MVSGGQTGVDRAALDVALSLGIACRGWCPRGRKAEDGRIAARYPLQETPSTAYSQRTEWNVRDSDGTLIVNRGALEGGSAGTLAWARRLGKPCRVVDLAAGAGPDAARAWIRSARIRVLNVAGPRESKRPGIYAQTRRFLRDVLEKRSRCGGKRQRQGEPWARV